MIFVVHSLGGLVIQDALFACLNANDDAQSDILASTCGVAFLGTPHAIRVCRGQRRQCLYGQKAMLKFLPELAL